MIWPANFAIYILYKEFNFTTIENISKIERFPCPRYNIK